MATALKSKTGEGKTKVAASSSGKMDATRDLVPPPAKSAAKRAAKTAAPKSAAKPAATAKPAKAAKKPVNPATAWPFPIGPRPQ